MKSQNTSVRSQNETSLWKFIFLSEWFAIFKRVILIALSLLLSKYLLLLFILFSMISQTIISPNKILQNSELPSRILLKIYLISRLNLSSLFIELLKSLSAKLKDLHSQIYFHELVHISDHVTSCLVFLLSSASNTINNVTNVFNFLISSVAFTEHFLALMLSSVMDIRTGQSIPALENTNNIYNLQIYLQIEVLPTFSFFYLTFLLSIKIKILKCIILFVIHI